MDTNPLPNPSLVLEHLDSVVSVLHHVASAMNHAILGFSYKGPVTTIDEFLGAGNQRSTYFLLDGQDVYARIITGIELGSTFDTLNIRTDQRSVNISHSVPGNYITFQTGVADKEGISGSHFPSSSLDAYIDGETYLSAVAEAHQALSSLATERGFSSHSSYYIHYTAEQSCFLIEVNDSSLQARLLVHSDGVVLPALPQTNDSQIAPSPRLYAALVSLLKPA